MNIRRIVAGLAATVLLGTSVWGEDVSGLVNELNDLKAKVAALEAAQLAPATSGDSEAMTSMRRRGSIRIGGEVAIDYMSVEREELGKSAVDNDKLRSARWGTGEANLDFLINASPDVMLKIRLDLDYDTNAGEELLDECYFMWKHIRGSDFDLVVGKKTVDYGLHRDFGMTDSFQRGLAEWFVGSENGGSALSTSERDQDYASVGTANSLPGAEHLERLMQVQGIYNYRDWAKVSATLFQSDKTMYENRPSDYGVQSGALQLEVTPMEGLRLIAGVINQHSERKGDNTLMYSSVLGNDVDSIATENSYGFDLAAEYTLPTFPLTVWAEYQRGYNADFQNDATTSTWSLGTCWHVTEAIDFGGMFEWAHIDEILQARSAVTNGVSSTQILGWDDQDYYQAVLNGKYTFDNGMYVMAEYALVWFNGELGEGRSLDGTTGVTHSTDIDRTAQMFGVRVGWQF